MMLPVQLAMPLALMVGAAIAATTAAPPHDGGWESATGQGDDTGTHRAKAGHGAMRMLRLSLQPGASLPWHRDAVPGTGYVLDGELHVRTSGTAKVMRSGDCLTQDTAIEGGTVAGPRGATVMVMVFEAEGRAARG